MKFVNSLLPYFPPINQTISRDLLSIDELAELVDKTDSDYEGFRGYQIFVQRFMSPLTPYKEILVKHSMGSGKTCTAFLIILAHYRGFGYAAKLTNRPECLVLAHNTSQLKNLRNGLHVCTQYLKTQDFQLEDYLRKHVKYSTFGSIKKQEFSSLLRNVAVVIIDEAHTIHLKKDESTGVISDIEREPLYTRMKLFLEEVKRQQKRIVLMTGTPISNHFSKLFQLMDLILPSDMHFAKLEVDVRATIATSDDEAQTAKVLDSFYFDTSTGDLKPIMVAEITKRFAGRISSLQKMRTHIKQIEMGGYYSLATRVYTPNPSNNIRNVYMDYMVGWQRENYIQLVKSSNIPRVDSLEDDPDLTERDHEHKREETSIFFTFPRGYKMENVVKDNDQSLSFLNRTITWKGSTLSFSDAIRRAEFLKEHSILYYNVLVEMGDIVDAAVVAPEEIPQRQREAVFFYNDVVQGTANKLFSLILKAYGYSQLYEKQRIESLYADVVAGNEATKGKRFAVISSNFGSTSDLDIDNIMHIFAHPNNKNGEYLRVIVGSKKLAFGYNLINGRQAHVVLQWNAPLMNQAIARLLRETSHFADTSERYVRVYRHFVGLEDVATVLPNICILFERRLRSMEIKEKRNARILHLLDSMAVDCFIHKKFHTSLAEFDNARECNFMPCTQNFACDAYLPPTATTTFTSGTTAVTTVTTDNSFLFHPSDEKMNLILATLSRLFHSGIVSFHLRVLIDIFTKSDQHRLTTNEVCYYTHKAIVQQVIFQNKYGMDGVIGNYRDIIFFKKSCIFLPTPEDIVYDITTPIICQPTYAPYALDEAFILDSERQQIVNFVTSGNYTLETYNKLNILSRVFLFESCIPDGTMLGSNIELKKFIENTEYRNYVYTSDLLAHKPHLTQTSDNDNNIQLTLASTICFHTIIPEYHAKGHTVRSDVVFQEGLRVFTKGDRVWKNLLLPESIVADIVNDILSKAPVVLVQHKTKPSSSSTSTSIVSSTPTPKRESQLDFRIEKGDDGDLKRVTIVKEPGVKQRKGQRCRTIAKAKLYEYLDAYLCELRRLLDAEPEGSTFGQSVLEKFTIPNEGGLKPCEVCCLIKTLIRNENHTIPTICDFLYELQQAIFD